MNKLIDLDGRFIGFLFCIDMTRDNRDSHRRSVMATYSGMHCGPVNSRMIAHEVKTIIVKSPS